MHFLAYGHSLLAKNDMQKKEILSLVNQQNLSYLIQKVGSHLKIITSKCHISFLTITTNLSGKS